MKTLILIKLGGSVVTDKSKPFKARGEVITRLAKEIGSGLKASKVKAIIGHGAGSFAHIPAAKYKTKEGFINRSSRFGMCVTEESARWLNMIVLKRFISQRLPVFPFSGASFLISDAKVCTKSYFDPIEKAIEIGVIPLVYGDVVVDKKLGCTVFSTERIFAEIAKKFRKIYKIRMIYVTNVDGVYDKNGLVIKSITTKNIKSLESSITGAKGVDVTGGMLHKVEAALALAKKYGIRTSIINGRKPGLLRKAIMGKIAIGTQVK